MAAKDGAAKKTGGKAAAKTESADGAAKVGGRESRFKDAMTITLGNDKEGNAYSSANNPHRAGSAAATRFGQYTPGMTVRAFRDVAGDRALSQLRRDTKRGYITVGE